MRTTALLLLFTAGAAANAAAQTDPETSPPVLVRESIALGALLTPALEGSGPWFMPGLRVSLPLGARHSLDVDAGRIFGGMSPYGTFRRFASAQIRFRRPPKESSSVGRYWFGGLQYLPERESDGLRKRHTALMIGRGWSQEFRATRVVSEIGFSGGDGFLFYVSAGLQWVVGS